MLELAAVNNCASLYHGNGSSVELVVCSCSNHHSFSSIPSEPHHTVSAGSRTQVLYSEFSVDLNVLLSNKACFSAFKITAKYEGHVGHRPSFCWIRQVS